MTNPPAVRPESELAQGLPTPTLRDLQHLLPWTIPYSQSFTAGATPLDYMNHDVLHVMKSLGRIAAECENHHHGRDRKLYGDALAKEVADLVICALHIAKLQGFDLQDAVINNSEARNGVRIAAPPPAPVAAPPVAQTGDGRAEFEAWFTKYHGPAWCAIYEDNGQKELMFHGWQAALRHRPQEEVLREALALLQTYRDDVAGSLFSYRSQTHFEPLAVQGVRIAMLERKLKRIDAALAQPQEK